MGKSQRVPDAGSPIRVHAGTADSLDGERKIVTFLFADIKGSMDLIEDLDPEEAQAIVDPALKLMIDAVQHSLNDGMSGPAPYTAKVPRNEDLTINVSAPGYQSETISDVSHGSIGYGIADIFLGGLIGLGIDAIDGAMYSHDQTMVAAHLEPLPQTNMPQVGSR